MSFRIRFQSWKVVPHPRFFLLALLGSTTVNAADAIPKRCITCHSEAVIVAKVAKMPAADRVEKLEAFLTNHFAPEPGERAAIVAELKARTEER